MEKNKRDFERNLLYRLIKVIYALAFILICLVVIVLGWTEKPYKYIDDNKSYVTCLSNKKTYTYSKINDYINKVPNRYKLNFYDQKNKANYVCEVVITNELKYRKGTDGTLEYYFGEVFSEFDQKWYSNTTDNRTIITNNVKNKFPSGIYQLHDVYSTTGSWKTVALTWLLGISISYIVLNLTRETLFYIFFGKKFSWEWFTKIITYG